MYLLRPQRIKTTNQQEKQKVYEHMETEYHALKD
jgi:hypothetical protein